MPEPDFDQIALTLVESLLLKPDGRVKTLAQVAVIAQLRVIWNARGAADITKIESELSSMMGSTAAGPYVKNLDRALRSLDR